MEVVASAHVIRPCRFPYVPGLLSFREAPAIIEAVRKLPRRPDLLVCDGQGLAHPRGLGLACHVGLWLEMPTIGAAKSRLCGEHRQVGRRRGCHVQLRHDGRVVGSVVRTRTGVKPLFVSVGHLVTLEEAIRIVLRCCRGVRLPEPTRRAHHLVSRLKKSLSR
jgi:deoxyribonuclease V